MCGSRHLSEVELEVIEQLLSNQYLGASLSHKNDVSDLAALYSCAQDGAQEVPVRGCVKHEVALHSQRCNAFRLFPHMTANELP